MAYNELIKNFEKVRSYMRAFYVYGFMSRNDHDLKSARSYDDERRRIESWLGEYMRFAMTPEGKSVFLSIDSRTSQTNPLYKAWKAKSFTDGDITLHFILFDILYAPGVQKTLKEILAAVDETLRGFSTPLAFDESTVRKKLKEYTEEGLIRAEKQGRRVLYRRADSPDIAGLKTALEYFSEVAPCGVIGSFLLDKLERHEPSFSFKHHYITQAMDSEVLAMLFVAIREKRYITVDYLNKSRSKTLRLVPLKIYISTQSGRQSLLALSEEANRLNAYRVDYLSNVRAGEPCERFDALRQKLSTLEPYMWGVNCKWRTNQLEHVRMTVRIHSDEGFILERLEREKRCGRVEQVDRNHYRFEADVFDSTEMVPWIRTFISRITSLEISNKAVEKAFKEDLRRMYSLYGVDAPKALHRPLMKG